MAKKKAGASSEKPETVHEATRRLRTMEGEHSFHLDLFGDFLAKREGYEALDGRDALHYYLVQKYRWLPAQVRALNVEDLRFLFAEDLAGWTVPKEFRE